eukprot:scaffold2938_cov125-Isochrysis_galbana.AAC.3
MSPKDCGRVSQPVRAMDDAAPGLGMPTASLGSGTGCCWTSDGRHSRITLSDTKFSSCCAAMAD